MAQSKMTGYIMDVDHGAQGELDALLLNADGLCRVIPAEDLLRFEHRHLAAWGNRHNLYQYPTAELVEWLQGHLTPKRSIEICAGRSIIGQALGIPQTDSGLQSAETEVDEMRVRFEVAGQQLRPLPGHVIKLEAMDAVKRYKPRMVIGCWVTELRYSGPGSSFGVDEQRLIKRVPYYVMAGNIETHGKKRILKRAHQVVQAPWLITRSRHPEQNRLWCWPTIPCTRSTP